MFVLLSLLTVCLFSAPDVSAALTDNQSSYQTAFLYFLPDYQPKDQDEAEVRGCRKIGYTFTRSNCAAPRILKDKCPIGNVFKTCYCAGSPTCTGSASSANPYPTSTGASMTSCVDCPGNTHYNWTCSSSACSAYTLSSCPANGYCSRCCSGKYKLDYCSSAYVVSGNFCVCATTCSDAVTSKPDNSSYTTTSCTACGITTTIKTGWSCNSGYVKSGSSCICAKTCTDAVTSKPANSSYTTSSCTACGITTTIKSGWSCNSGYVKSGSSCICAKTCTDAVTAKPANSSYTTSSCTACGITTTIKSGWSCNSGYTKSGSSCVEECNSNSAKWCPVHNSCHVNCCTDGTIKPCNPQCGGSGCDPCDDITCPSGQICSEGKCISACVSGGSSSCTGQTSSCSSSQRQVSSCKDCSGTTLYTCKNVVRGDVYYVVIPSDYYRCEFREYIQRYETRWACNVYCDINGVMKTPVDRSNYNKHCVGYTYLTEEKCLADTSGPHLDAYYPEGGRNNCLADED